jgi:hypothetical protein
MEARFYKKGETYIQQVGAGASKAVLVPFVQTSLPICQIDAVDFFAQLEIVLDLATRTAVQHLFHGLLFFPCLALDALAGTQTVLFASSVCCQRSFVFKIYRHCQCYIYSALPGSTVPSF